MSDTINVVVAYPDTYNGGYYLDILVYRDMYDLSSDIGSVLEGQKLICEYTYNDKWLRIVGVIHNIGQDDDQWYGPQYNAQLDTLVGGYIDKSFTFEFKSDEEYDASLDKLTEREMVYDIYSRLRFGKNLEDPDKYRTHSIQSSGSSYYGNQYGYYDYNNNDLLAPSTALVKKLNAKLIMAMPQTISKNISGIHTVTIPIGENSFDTEVSATVYGRMDVVLAYLEKAMVDVSSIITTDYESVEYEGGYKEVYPADATSVNDEMPTNYGGTRYASVTKFTLNWDSPGFINNDNLKIYYVYKGFEHEVVQ